MSCTCAGIAPGYPQHEHFCGRREHAVQVESDTIQLYRWHCETCGIEGDGYTSLRDAEAAADNHGAA